MLYFAKNYSTEVVYFLRSVTMHHCMTCIKSWQCRFHLTSSCVHHVRIADCWKRKSIILG
jgi:hypothetical protein